MTDQCCADRISNVKKGEEATCSCCNSCAVSTPLSRSSYSCFRFTWVVITYHMQWVIISLFHITTGLCRIRILSHFTTSSTYWTVSDVLIITDVKTCFYTTVCGKLWLFTSNVICAHFQSLLIWTNSSSLKYGQPLFTTLLASWMMWRRGALPMWRQLVHSSSSNQISATN